MDGSSKPLVGCDIGCEVVGGVIYCFDALEEFWDCGGGIRFGIGHEVLVGEFQSGIAYAVDWERVQLLVDEGDAVGSRARSRCRGVHFGSSMVSE